MTKSLLQLVLLYFTVVGGAGQTPEWIWHKNGKAEPGETRYFRKVFNLPFAAKDGSLIASGDDEIIIFLNGREVGRSEDWRKPVAVEVTKLLREGSNVLAVQGRNGSTGPAGVVLKVEVRSPNNFGLFIVTDGSWLSTDKPEENWRVNPESSGWVAARSLGKVPVEPWGNVFGDASATAASELKVADGFKVELLKSANSAEGSWICMTFDDKGRIIVSPERTERPLLRISPGKNGVGEVRSIPAGMRAAMGLCYAYDSLYVNGQGPRGVGLYRLRDRNGNDQFDPGEEELLLNFEGASEHGYHAVTQGPDGMIYVINGNMTKVPLVREDSPLKNFQEDLLLPRMWDPTGHAKGIMAPGGYVLRGDPEGKSWELFCGGFRNAYDFDFNEQGELFTFDSDMEYDLGLPWYRPTRILHCVSGGEFGWRSGSGKWPEYYADSLPASVNVGLSSPTGVKFGARSRFPEKYKKALFACDWNYGRILAVDLQENRSTYKGDFEVFLSGKPLPVVDIEFGLDGNMYFITGGWRTQSGLYRVSYERPIEEKSGVLAINPAAELRHELEKFQRVAQPGAVEMIWPHLGNPERFIRFAARVALERQHLEEWKERALKESEIKRSLSALLALARKGEGSMQSAVIRKALAAFKQTTDESEKLEASRIIQVSLIRMGKVEESFKHEIASNLPFESGGIAVEEEISAILVFLQDPRVLPFAVEKMKTAPSKEEQIYYAFIVRNLTNGWSDESLKAWFEWSGEALMKYRGGVSFAKYIENAREELLKRLRVDQKKNIEELLARKETPVEPLKLREFVRNWTFEELLPAISSTTQRRSWSSGHEAFATQCASCHRFGNEGGAVGPDLSSVASRFSRRELLENIIYPSKVISERFATVTITRLDGEELTGIVTEESRDTLTLQVNPLTPTVTQIHKGDIKERSTSTVSMMPEGLLQTLKAEEVADLIEFLATPVGSGIQ